MPIGHQGQKRLADLIGCAITVAKIATGEIEEILKPKSGRVRSGHAGSKARHESLTPNKRSNIAKKAAKARWNK